MTSAPFCSVKMRSPACRPLIHTFSSRFPTIRYERTPSGLHVRPTHNLSLSGLNVFGNLGRVIGEVILYRIEARRSHDRLRELQMRADLAPALSMLIPACNSRTWPRKHERWITRYRFSVRRSRGTKRC